MGLKRARARGELIALSKSRSTSLIAPARVILNSPVRTVPFAPLMTQSTEEVTRSIEKLSNTGYRSNSAKWYPWLRPHFEQQLIASYQAGRGHHALLIPGIAGHG